MLLQLNSGLMKVRVVGTNIISSKVISKSVRVVVKDVSTKSVPVKTAAKTTKQKLDTTGTRQILVNMHRSGGLAKKAVPLRFRALHAACDKHFLMVADTGQGVVLKHNPKRVALGECTDAIRIIFDDVEGLIHLKDNTGKDEPTWTVFTVQEGRLEEGFEIHMYHELESGKGKKFQQFTLNKDGTLSPRHAPHLVWASIASLSETEVDRAIANNDLDALSFGVKIGQPSVLHRICAQCVPGWKDSLLVAATHLRGGLSGAIIYRVQVRVKGDESSVVLRLMGHGGSERDDWMFPGRVGGLAMSAHRAWGQADAFAHFPRIYYPPAGAGSEMAIPGLSVIEFAAGTSLATTPHGFSQPKYLYSTEDATAFGSALGRLHSNSAKWYHEAVRKAGRTEADFVEMLSGVSFGGYILSESEAGKALLKITATHGYKKLAIAQGCLPHIPSTDAERFVSTLVTVANLVGPDTLVGRLVVGHGDLHARNMIRRRSVEAPGDILFIDFDGVCRMAAGYDLAYGLSFFWDGSLGGVDRKYPSLEHRRVAVQAYIDAVGKESIRSHTRTSVDEIVYDIEKSVLLPTLIWGTVGFQMSSPSAYHTFVSTLDAIDAMIEMFRAADDDKIAKQNICTFGIWNVLRKTT